MNFLNMSLGVGHQGPASARVHVGPTGLMSTCVCAWLHFACFTFVLTSLFLQPTQASMALRPSGARTVNDHCFGDVGPTHS